MTDFEQLKLIYNQFFNLATEIKSMINNEEYNEAISKLQYKEALIEKFATAKKTMNLTETEMKEMHEIEAKFIEAERNNLDFLKNLRSEVANELKKVNSNLKITKAYSKKAESQGGSILDLSE
jgi:hypothetical protein